MANCNTRLWFIYSSIFICAWILMYASTRDSIVANELLIQHSPQVRLTDTSVTGLKYEEDLAGCSIPVFSNDSILKSHLSQTHRTGRICTPTFFKKYFKRYGHFVNDGAWYVPNDTYPENIDFYPRDCYFDPSFMGRLDQCFAKDKITKIVVHGDSNGLYYFKAFMNLLDENSFKCSLIREKEQKAEPTQFDPYFALPGGPIVQRRKGCSNCDSAIYSCQMNISRQVNKSKVIIEFIGMSGIMDDAVYPLNISDTIDKRVTFLEYLLRDYFPYYGMPDVWIATAPFHHESWKYKEGQHVINMDAFAQILDKFLPKSTKMLILSDSRECLSYQRRDVFEGFRYISSYSKNVILHIMNQVLFKSLQSKLTADVTNIYGFLDIGVLACPFTCRWHLDGAHMLQPWYDKMMKLIFQYLCSENITSI